MASPFFSPPSSANPCSLAFQNGLPSAVDHLLRQLSVCCVGLLGSPYNNGAAHQHQRQHQHRRPQHPRNVTTLRTPKFSALGFASLLLGISSTLMFFGSFAFMLGFMLMPLILPATLVVFIGALLAGFKSPLIGLRTPASSSSSGSTILQTKLRF